MMRTSLKTLFLITATAALTSTFSAKAQQPADKRGKPQAEREREAQRAQCGGGAEQTDRNPKSCFGEIYKYYESCSNFIKNLLK